jgi:hypothetical protein
MDEKLQKAYEKALLTHLPKDEVTGVVVGYRHKDGELTDEVCIGIRVKEKKPLEELSKAERLPKTILGVRTDVVEANPKGFVSYRRLDPVTGGVSIGKETELSAGTLGCVVYDKSNAYALTNAHVVIQGSLKSSEEYILQPSRIDGGVIDADRIGAVTKATADLRGDFAIIKIDPALRGHGSTIAESNEEFVMARNPELDEVVEKVGRTSGLTQGRIAAIGTFIEDITESGLGHVTINGFEIVPLVDPYELIGGPGDSGAVYYLPEKKTAVGILCAGISSPCIIFGAFITNVLEDYGLTLKQQDAVVVKTPATEEEQVVYNFVNAGWTSNLEQREYHFDMTFQDDLTRIFLYTNPEFAGILEAKLSTENDYWPIGFFSMDPTCILGNAAKNTQVTIDIKIANLPNSTDELVIPVMIGYGELVSFEGRFPDGFFWRSPGCDVFGWGSNAEEVNWLMWRDS